MELFGFDTDHAWDYENGFNITSHPTRMAKIIAHYELYKHITGLPGHVVECGVFKAGSLLRFATFRDMLESPNSREIIGFDVFGEFAEGAPGWDKAYADQARQVAGRGLTVVELYAILEQKGFGNVHLEAGDVSESVPAYLAQRPELRIALLHLDLDLYEPTRGVLGPLFTRMVPGGLVVLDDYGTEWGGTQAIEEFLADTFTPSERPELCKLSISHASPTYFVAGPMR